MDSLLGPEDDDDRSDTTLDDATSDDVARREALLSGLNPAQRVAVCHEAMALRILAGAGSGKTRVLTRRIARRVLDGEIDPRRVLAVTFTRKAASELRGRIATLGLRGGVNAGTFHAIAYTQLRQRWEERRVEPPELLARKVGFVAGLMRAKSSTAPLDVVSEIEWAKARMLSAGDYAAAAHLAGRRPSIELDDVASIFVRYEEKKLTKRMVDFDDLLRLATRDMEQDTEFAAARRWRFRHLFIDEFQDVNPLQFRLLQSWVGPKVDLCIVGDPNQAIYAWNGADSQYLDRFEEWYPGAATVELADNYRSSPQILGVANIVLSQTDSRRFDLVPHRAAGPIPTVTMLADETTEARVIARRVRDNHGPGQRWGAQAVLVRTNAQLTVIEEAFTAAKIPFRSRGAGRFLDQPEIRDALAVLRQGGGSLTARLADLDATLSQRSSRSANSQQADDDLASLDLTEPMIDLTTGDDTSSTDEAADFGDERTANIAELVRLGREFLDLSPEGSVPSFMAWLHSALRNDASGGGDGVDLATFHAAKGLEWSIVHIAGLEEGLVPIHFAQTSASQAEEHRLLYVALTRAERELHLTYCQRRSFGSRSLTRKPSPHLETINLALEFLGRSGDITDLSTAVAAQREALAHRSAVAAAGAAERKTRGRSGSAAATDLSPADRELLDRLKRWRLEHARAANVPAFVIFNDATLIEVAVDRPSTPAQLLRVAGIGAVKAQRFGPDILRIVAEST